MNLKCAECGEKLKQNKGVALTTATLAIHHEKVVCNMVCFKNFHQVIKPPLPRPEKLS